MGATKRAVILAALWLFCAEAFAVGVPVNFKWEQPDKTNVSGYLIGCGREHGDYGEPKDVPGAENTKATLMLESGEWYCAVRAYGAKNIGASSQEIHVSVPAPDVLRWRLPWWLALSALSIIGVVIYEGIARRSSAANSTAVS